MNIFDEGAEREIVPKRLTETIIDGPDLLDIGIAIQGLIKSASEVRSAVGDFDLDDFYKFDISPVNEIVVNGSTPTMPQVAIFNSPQISELTNSRFLVFVKAPALEDGSFGDIHEFYGLQFSKSAHTLERIVKIGTLDKRDYDFDVAEGRESFGAAVTAMEVSAQTGPEMTDRLEMNAFNDLLGNLKPHIPTFGGFLRSIGLLLDNQE